MIVKVILAALLLPAVGIQTKEVTLRVHENHLRTKAISSTQPRFPPEAQRAKAAGVAVANIKVDKTGRVSDVAILESPHPSAGEAVREALYRWRFTAFTIKGKPHNVKGKLTFYFVLDGRGARVENPHPW